MEKNQWTNQEKNRRLGNDKPLVPTNRNQKVSLSVLFIRYYHFNQWRKFGFLFGEAQAQNFPTGR